MHALLPVPFTPEDVERWQLKGPLCRYSCGCGWSLLAGRHAIEPLTIALVAHKDGHYIGGRVFRPTPLRGAPTYMVDWHP